MTCKNVLLIDDDAAILQMMHDVLEIEGYQISVARNGAEAIEILRRASPLPCVILLDLMMPVLNGWEFLDFQRNDPKFKDIPLVICSAYQESAKAINPAAYLKKPLHYQPLVETIKKFCS